MDQDVDINKCVKQISKERGNVDCQFEENSFAPKDSSVYNRVNND